MRADEDDAASSTIASRTGAASAGAADVASSGDGDGGGEGGMARIKSLICAGRASEHREDSSLSGIR